VLALDDHSAVKLAPYRARRLVADIKCRHVLLQRVPNSARPLKGKSSSSYEIWPLYVSTFSNPFNSNIRSVLFYQTLVHKRCCGMEGEAVTWTMHLDHPVGQCVTHGLAVCPPQFLVNHLLGGSMGPPSFTFAVGIAVLIYMRLSGTIGPRL
jgi:hypothetical protein